VNAEKPLASLVLFEFWRPANNLTGSEVIVWLPGGGFVAFVQ
jgi:hypothetical protein